MTIPETPLSTLPTTNGDTHQSDIAVERFTPTERSVMVAERKRVPRNGLLHRIDGVFTRLQSAGWRTAHGVFLGCCSHCELHWYGVGPRRPVALAFYLEPEWDAPSPEYLNLIVDTVVSPRDLRHGSSLAKAEQQLRSVLPDVGLLGEASRPFDGGGRLVPLTIIEPRAAVVPAWEWDTCGERV
jgi:hypothetical protein